MSAIINNRKDIAIYDLDGTLLPFNSFKYWLAYSFILSLFFFRIDYNWLIFKLTLQRIFKKINRIVFKEKIVNFHEQNKNKAFAKRCNASFASFLKRKTRNDLLDKHAQLVLATAAPDCYVKYYVAKMDCFENYSASYIVNHKLNENINERKLQSVSQLIGNKIHQSVLYSDHHDDIPLAQKVAQVFLVSPTEETMKQYELSKIPYSVVDFRN